MAPIGFFYVLAIASIDPEQLELFPEDTQSEPELPEASVFVGLGVTYILGILALLVCFGACYKVVSDSWLGKRTNMQGDAELRAPARADDLPARLIQTPPVHARRLDPVLRALVWLGVAWCLAFPALLFEKIGPA